MSVPVDTLIANKELLDRFHSDEAYNYGRELVAPDVDVLELIVRFINEFLNELFGTYNIHLNVKSFLAIVGAFLILALSFLLYKNRNRMFMRVGTAADDSIPHEDTIYGIDFESVVRDALARKDYKLAVRMLYLQTLRRLADQDVIDWQPHKTPSQYVEEVCDGDFKSFTELFVRVRYGNYPASEEMIPKVRQWQENVFYRILDQSEKMKGTEG